MPKFDAKLAKKNFKHYPRGRVIYIVKSKEFEIYADKHIVENEKILDEIKSEFRIPQNTKAVHSPHYYCHKCELKEDHSLLVGRHNKQGRV